jgi:hypothetical protein
MDARVAVTSEHMTVQPMEHVGIAVDDVFLRDRVDTVTVARRWRAST